MRAGTLVVFGQKRTPQGSHNTEHLKVVAGHYLCPDAFNLAAISQAPRNSLPAHKTFENFSPVTEVAVHRVRHRIHAPVGTVVRAPSGHLNNACGILDWKHAQEQLVEKTEDCRVGADPQPERQDSNHRKDWGPCQGSKSEAEVLPECVHA